MRFSTLMVALFATVVTADPVLSNRGVSQLSTPFLDKRSDTVLTLDGRLISRQDVRIYTRLFRIPSTFFVHFADRPRLVLRGSPRLWLRQPRMSNQICPLIRY